MTPGLALTRTILIPAQWMDTALFAIATVVDLVLTGAFVAILRRSRTGILGYGPLRDPFCLAVIRADDGGFIEQTLRWTCSPAMRSMRVSLI